MNVTKPSISLMRIPFFSLERQGKEEQKCKITRMYAII